MLSDKQLAAIDQLSAGMKRKDVEASVGVSHAQLWRWTRDPEFKAIWEGERVLRHQERSEALWRLTERAIEVAHESLDEGDPRMAIDILKLAAPGLVDVQWIPVGWAEKAEGAAPRLPESPDGSSRGYQCETCGKECKSAGALGSHRRTHA